jgi:hypothetical protein
LLGRAGGGREKEEAKQAGQIISPPQDEQAISISDHQSLAHRFRSLGIKSREFHLSWPSGVCFNALLRRIEPVTRPPKKPLQSGIGNHADFELRITCRSTGRRSPGLGSPHIPWVSRLRLFEVLPSDHNGFYRRRILAQAAHRFTANQYPPHRPWPQFTWTSHREPTGCPMLSPA